jgi:uncharacterized protein (DUF1697 family)
VKRFVALLRGVNVSGRNKVGMAELRARLGDLGFQDVTTYIQSGNIVLASRATGQAALAGVIEAEIRRAFHVEVTVLVRTREQLHKISAVNPFLTRGRDRSALHVTFLAGSPASGDVRALSARAAGPDDCVVVGREVYLHCPNGYGKTKLNNTYLERVLKVRATTRNWKTVLTLRELIDA